MRGCGRAKRRAHRNSQCRGLAVWLALHAHGVAAFRAELDRMLDLAVWTAQALSEIDGIEVTTSQSLSVVTFCSTGGDAETRRMQLYVNASGDVHLSSTTIGERFVIRAAFLSHRTTSAVAERLVELVREAVR